MKQLEKAAAKYDLYFQTEIFGYSYFYGIKPLEIQGAYIGTYSQYSDDFKRFSRYCKKYGYTLKYHRYCDGMTYFTACRSEDSKQLETYAKYCRMSVNACEKTMYLQHKGMFPGETEKEFDERLKRIMEVHEEWYKDALKTA